MTRERAWSRGGLSLRASWSDDPHSTAYWRGLGDGLRLGAVLGVAVVLLLLAVL